MSDETAQKVEAPSTARLVPVVNADQVSLDAARLATPAPSLHGVNYGNFLTLEHQQKAVLHAKSGSSKLASYSSRVGQQFKGYHATSIQRAAIMRAEHQARVDDSLFRARARSNAAACADRAVEELAAAAAAKDSDGANEGATEHTGGAEASAEQRDNPALLQSGAGLVDIIVLGMFLLLQMHAPF